MSVELLVLVRLHVRSSAPSVLAIARLSKFQAVGLGRKLPFSPSRHPLLPVSECQIEYLAFQSAEFAFLKAFRDDFEAEPSTPSYSQILLQVLVTQALESLVTN